MPAATVDTVFRVFACRALPIGAIVFDSIWFDLNVNVTYSQTTELNLTHSTNTHGITFLHVIIKFRN